MRPGFLALLLLAAGPEPLRAHSFFPMECCGPDRDCWTMGADADAREPDPSLVSGGYLTFDGQFVPESETRPSPDGRFHICRRGGAVTGQVIWPEKRPICMWAPRPSS